MGLELKLIPKLSQRLIMTPILQQVIKLLPMTRLELVSAIRQELEENPLLEEAQEQETQEETKPETEPEAEAPADGFEEEAVINDKQEKKNEEIDWESFFQEEAYDGATGEGFSERPSIENMIRAPKLLPEHLLWQLNLTVMEPILNKIGQIIISEIDQDGFFKADMADVASQAGATVEEVKKALEIIKTFDPTGIGAVDLKECLLIQMENLEPDDPIIRELILGYLPQLSERNYVAIAKKLGVDTERIVEAMEFIRSLDPAPGMAFSPEKPLYVIPDMYIVPIDDDYQVILNDDGVPRLKINSHYKRILKNQNSNSINGETKDFITNKFRSAIWLIKSIEQRRQTMMRVGTSIVKFQRGFMDHGIAHLQPLVLKDVAEDINMHESTISRVTRNKYMHTPQGIFELKFFFHGGVGSYLGSTVSSVRVKEMIKKIVTEEDMKKPVTDDRMVELLQTQDVKIARRTITKYRKELGIQSASKRKRIY